MDWHTVGDFIANNGLAIFLVVFYLLVELPRQRSHQEKLQQNLISGIKKELNIDDLERDISSLEVAIIGLDKSLKDSNQNTMNNVNVISDAINMINVDLTELRKIINNRMDETKTALVEKVDSTKDIIEKSKLFTDEEMYETIMTRMSLTITTISRTLQKKVRKNNLRVNEDVLYQRIERVCVDNMKKGRTYICSRNFDQRIINTIFKHTNDILNDAMKDLIHEFKTFLCKEPGTEQQEDYDYLEDRIGEIENDAIDKVDRMLQLELKGITI